MTQENKNLLLKDLCARLPYGVKFQAEDSNVYTLDAANYFALQVGGVVFKPYLRPMSSMTKEEKEEYLNLDPFTNGWFAVADWLNAHQFDYRGLIEGDLALEAPEGMYKTIDSLQQEQSSESLEEAAEEYFYRNWSDGSLDIKPQVKEDFKAGAEWQVEQFEKNRIAACDKQSKEEYDREVDFATDIIEKEHRNPTFSDAINYGMDRQKERMLKEAVECVVCAGMEGDKWIMTYIGDYESMLKTCKAGDKVHIIIVKKD